MDSTRRLLLEWRSVAHRRRSAMIPRALSFLACAALFAALGPTVLALRDFKPRSMLVVPEHQVPRAAFPAIDVHNHVNDAHGEGRAVPVTELLARMDRLNLKRIVILTGRWGQALQQVVDQMVKPHPDRFTVFTEPDWSRIDEPGIGTPMGSKTKDAVPRGAR